MEDELFDYGTFKLRKDALVHNISNEKNLLKYINAYRLNEQDARDFRNAVAYLAEGIANGTITKDLNFKPEPGNEGQIQMIDNTGGLNNHSKWGGKAISYLSKIADAQGKHKENKKATQVKEKEYDDISTYLAKSLYPNATGLLDPNIDWDSFKKKYSGQAHKAAYDILSGFTKSENTNPELKAKLETILPKLVDADGITVDDKLELNRAGISGQFIPFLEKQLEVVTPPGGGQGNNGNGDQGNGKKEDPPVITPKDTTPELGEQVADMASATKDGHWFIDGHDKNRIKYVLWNGNFEKMPISFINEDNFNNLRELLQQGYKNLYKEKNIDETLKKVRDLINEHGLSSDNATNDIDLIRDESINKLYDYLFKLKYKRPEIAKKLRELSILPENSRRQIEFAADEEPGNYWNNVLNTFVNSLTNPQFHKQGGNIIKAQDGAELDNWFTKRYSQKALTNWTPKLRKDYWKQTTGFHGDANSLASVYDANTNYTSDINAIRSDLNNYAKNGKFTDKTAFINDYNTKIKALNDFFKQDRTYGEDTGEHATIFKNIYASRSGSGNLNYDLGFQDDLKTSMGSTMWHRRADQYEKEFNDLTDLEKQKRLHFVEGLGYIYKNPDGSIAAFDNEEEAKRILALTSDKVTPPKNETPPAAVPGDDSSVRVKSELDTEKLPEKEEQIDIPGTPSKLAVNTPFIGAGLLDAYLTNKHIYDLSQKMPFAVRPPINLHRNTYGNLRALAEANNRAGQRNAMTRQLFTSDQSFNSALMMDTFNKNVEDWQNALAIDDNTQRDTAEKAYQEKKEAYLTNQEIAWNNKQAAVQKEKEDILSDITKTTANYQSRKNALDEYKTYLMADITKRNEEKLTLAHNRLWNHIQQSPVSYIGGWTMEDQKLWNRYLAGDTITDTAEKQKLMQIQNLMNDVYLQKRFPDAGFKMPHMNNIRLLPPDYDDSVVTEVKRKGGLLKYLSKNKSGGKVTNDQVKAIIQYLKESNKNYNKAIDRSVKGLYNSIKLQKERKK